MTLLLWCVVAACGLPYVAHVVEGVGRVRVGYDNRTPRRQHADMTGWAGRAWAAQQNAWEALPVFAAIALIAHVTGADPAWAGPLGVAWVAFRLAHVAAYVGDAPLVRSTLFGLANLCNLGLVALAATAG